MNTEESFKLLFEDWTPEDVSTVLSLIRKCLTTNQTDNEVLRALHLSLCVTMKNYPVDELEEELFEIACPTAGNLIEKKLKYLEEENPGKCAECLKFCLDILSNYQQVFLHLQQNESISLLDVKSLTSSSCELLLKCFSHCRESEKTYGGMFMAFTDNLSGFFKKCCELLEHLLNFLTEKIKCDVEDEREIVQLDELLSFLSKLGVVLIDLEVKAMAKVWKCYLFLLEKYSSVLRNVHNIGEIITTICNSIQRKLDLSQTGEKELVKIIKLNCFLLKLVIKFTEILAGALGNCHGSLVQLLLMLCRCNEKNTNQDLLNQFIIGTQPLLSSLISDKDFICEFAKNCSDSIEFICLCCLVLRKLVDSDSSTRALWFNENENILKLVFKSFSSCQVLLSTNIRLPNIHVSGQQKTYTDLYEYVLVTTSAFAMTATAEEFTTVEDILILNVLQEEPMKALLAIDTWCLLGRFADSQLCLSQLLALGQLYRSFHPETLRIEKWYLASLIRRLFPLLSDNHRKVFLESFDPCFHSRVWEGSTLDCFTPAEVHKVREGVLSEFGELLTDSDTGSFEDKIVKLWRFDCKVLSSTLQRLKFLKTLCNATVWIVPHLPPEDLDLILSQIKKLLSFDQPSSVKLYFTSVLNSLSKVRIPSGNLQKRTIATIADIFRCLLSSKEILVKLKTLEVFYHFAHVTSHGEIITLSVQNAPQLREEVTKYFKKEERMEPELSSDVKEAIGALCKMSLDHVCPEMETEVGAVAKRMKLSLREEEEVLKTWKDAGRRLRERWRWLSEMEVKEAKEVAQAVLSLGMER